MSGQGLNFTTIFDKYIMFFYLKLVLLSFCTPMDICHIFNVLCLPPIWDIGNGGWVPGLEAFCIFLYFCTRPCTLLDIGDKFSHSESLVSWIVSMAFKFVYFHIKSTLFWDQARLTLGSWMNMVMLLQENQALITEMLSILVLLMAFSEDVLIWLKIRKETTAGGSMHTASSFKVLWHLMAQWCT